MILKNKRVLITGGAKGIGFATALRLVREGCEVVLWDLDEKTLDDAKSELIKNGGNVSTFICDISKNGEVQKTAAVVREEIGKIDILINNAGYVKGGAFTDEDISVWDKTVQVNLNGLLYCTHAFLPEMYKENSGIIINISSASGLIGVPDLSVYAAIKWAVWGFTESMRLESRKRKKWCQMEFNTSGIHSLGNV